MNEYKYITLRKCPNLKEDAALWFHNKWEIPKDAYLKCMEDYLNHKTEYGWYLCLDNNDIIGGVGVIENDFHDRKDLTPNICALYVEPTYRNQKIAGKLLDYAINDLKSKGINPVYLITDHTNFYERYGWEYLCMVKEDNSSNMIRMYIHN